jgi:hypothetical protein
VTQSAGAGLFKVTHIALANRQLADIRLTKSALIPLLDSQIRVSVIRPSPDGPFESTESRLTIRQFLAHEDRRAYIAIVAQSALTCFFFGINLRTIGGSRSTSATSKGLVGSSFHSRELQVLLS